MKAAALFCALLCALWGAFAHARAADLDPRALSVETLVGQMVMIGFRGDAADPAGPLMRDIRERGLGGVILFDKDVKAPGATRNIVSPEQVRALIRALQAAALTPLFVAVDQEGGRVCRLRPETGFSRLPSAQEMGRGSVERTRALGASLGAELRGLGFTMNFAPVADVSVNPASPAIGALGRAFSGNPAVVTAHARAFLLGQQQAGVLGCLKHFPGHGSALADTHLGVADITRTWRKDVELAPYAVLLREGCVQAVMVGHLYNAELDPVFPASLSQAVIQGLLREKLGFQGLVISDDLQMKAVRDQYSLHEVFVRGVNAGIDILVFGNNLEYEPDILKRLQAIAVMAVAKGEVPRARLEESYARIMRAKAKLTATQGNSPDRRAGSDAAEI